jgi:hypothetical protein
MLKPWAEITRDFIFTVGSIGTIASFVRTQIQFYRAIKIKEQEAAKQGHPAKFKFPAQKTIPEKEKFSTKVKRFAYSYRITLLIIVASSAVVAFLYIFGKTEPNPPFATPAPVVTPVAILAFPAKGSVKDAWLDELEPILPRKNAFFMREWSKFDLIQVEETTYPHSMGICIPYEDQLSYYEENPSEEQTHSEFIEYLLSYKYQSFQFDYGIDDISFPEDIETASMCEFKIVVQSCNSKEYLGKSDNILFDSDWINYRSALHRSPLIDVSAYEAIRITVFWKFYVRQTGPIAFNLAVINPILRVAKTDAMENQIPKPTTKPDSIR